MALSTLALTVSMCDGLSFEGLIRVTVGVGVSEGVEERERAVGCCVLVLPADQV